MRKGVMGFAGGGVARCGKGEEGQITVRLVGMIRWRRGEQEKGHDYNRNYQITPLI